MTQPNTTLRDSHHTRRSSFIDAIRNIALLVGLFAAYSIVRNVSGDDFAAAVENSGRVLNLEALVGLPHEASIQAGLLNYPNALRAANFYYMWAHFPVTGLFLVWAWTFHRRHFPVIRNTIIIVTGAGLAIHVLYPLAPPRMLPGFIDTGITFGPSPYALGNAAETANQLAAMPSLHVGWALLVALSYVAISDHRWRFLALGHPLLTAFVVVLTANHYWTDAIVAVALVLLAWGLVWRREHRLAFQEFRIRQLREARDPFETFAMDLTARKIDLRTRLNNDSHDESSERDPHRQRAEV